MAELSEVIADIEQASGLSLSNCRMSSVGGGCINTAYKLTTDDTELFIKLNQQNRLDMFEAEAQGLSEFAALDCVRVPKVICYGTGNGQSYLALEYIPLSGLRGHAGVLLGQQLAQLHQQPQAYFGWHRDNTIGSTAQINTREHDWIEFWQHHRLGEQLAIAARQGYQGRLQDRGQMLIEKVPLFFDNYRPDPVLLHGDLWGGNAAADDKGNPVIFDPATYYGDRETDMAMTELFGGFSHDFMQSYQSEYPLDAGYRTRKTLYNLYHIINHVNLFGSGYLGQAESMIEQLLAQV